MISRLFFFQGAPRAWAALAVALAAALAVAPLAQAAHVVPPASKAAQARKTPQARGHQATTRASARQARAAPLARKTSARKAPLRPRVIVLPSQALAAPVIHPAVAEAPVAPAPQRQRYVLAAPGEGPPGAAADVRFVPITPLAPLTPPLPGAAPAVPLNLAPLGSPPALAHRMPGQPALRSNIAYMVDRHSGQTLFDKNSQAIVPIASVTKLMMAMVALDARAPLDERIEVTEDDRDLEKNTGSRLPVGSVLSRQDMLHIALMASENRAAAALSRYYAGGRPAFMAAMNQKARLLGMLDTHFENPAGLSPRNVSSARDLVKMVEAAYQYPLIREFSTDAGYQVQVRNGRGVIRYRNTNHLLSDPAWDIGLQKTGFINESGICLVMHATVEGRPVVIVLLDSVGRNSDFADAKRLRAMLRGSDAHGPGAARHIAAAAGEAQLR